MMPHTISSILAGLGRGIDGALTYIGSADVPTFKHPEDRLDEECRPSYPSEFTGGVFKAEVYVAFDCNGREGEGWTFYVSYEADDTFTVWLIATKVDCGTVLAERDAVFIDSLQAVVERSYDLAIQEFNDSVIPG